MNLWGTHIPYIWNSIVKTWNFDALSQRLNLIWNP
jgi:hypothetical protein